MSDVIKRDAVAFHQALQGNENEVQLTLSRETVEWLTRIVDAHSRRHQIIVTHRRDEFSPADAVKILGVSHPQIRKLIDATASSDLGWSAATIASRLSPTCSIRTSSETIFSKACH